MQQKHLSLLFLVQGDEVLLAMKKQGFGAGRYNGVGGKVEPGESIEAAMIREAQEEIAITPLEYDFVADLRFNEYFKGQPTLMHVYVFVAQKWSGNPQESNEMKPEWFQKANIPYDQMWSDDRFWLALVLDGHKISADFTLDRNDDIVSHNVVIVDDLTLPFEPVVSS